MKNFIIKISKISWDTHLEFLNYIKKDINLIVYYLKFFWSEEKKIRLFTIFINENKSYFKELVEEIYIIEKNLANLMKIINFDSDDVPSAIANRNNNLYWKYAIDIRNNFINENKSYFKELIEEIYIIEKNLDRLMRRIDNNFYLIKIIKSRNFIYLRKVLIGQLQKIKKIRRVEWFQKLWLYSYFAKITRDSKYIQMLFDEITKINKDIDNILKKKKTTITSYSINNFVESTYTIEETIHNLLKKIDGDSPYLVDSNNGDFRWIDIRNNFINENKNYFKELIEEIYIIEKNLDYFLKKTIISSYSIDNFINENKKYFNILSFKTKQMYNKFKIFSPEFEIIFKKLINEIYDIDSIINYLLKKMINNFYYFFFYSYKHVSGFILRLSNFFRFSLHFVFVYILLFYIFNLSLGFILSGSVIIIFFIILKMFVVNRGHFKVSDKIDLSVLDKFVYNFEINKTFLELNSDQTLVFLIVFDKNDNKFKNFAINIKNNE